jgi:two-component system CitB family response regulator
VDVIVITAAKDADSVRAAMQGGALHYLLKPFGFPALRDKLLSYAQMRSRLEALREPDQRNVDRVFGALRAPDQLAGAKGRSPHTLEAVEKLLATGGQEMSATEVAEVTGMSRATAQRYLSHLHEVGRVEIRLRYGSGGRPEHRYRWGRTSDLLPAGLPSDVSRYIVLVLDSPFWLRRARWQLDTTCASGTPIVRRSPPSYASTTRMGG